MDAYPLTYLSFACAIGITKREVDTFAERLDKTLTEFRKKIAAAERKDVKHAKDEGKGSAGGEGVDAQETVPAQERQPGSQPLPVEEAAPGEPEEKAR
jgi:hypothetical protein